MTSILRVAASTCGEKLAEIYSGSEAGQFYLFLVQSHRSVFINLGHQDPPQDIHDPERDVPRYGNGEESDRGAKAMPLGRASDA